MSIEQQQGRGQTQTVHRHRRFRRLNWRDFFSSNLFESSVIFAFLLAIGVGVGIKFYLSKVSEPKF